MRVALLNSRQARAVDPDALWLRRTFQLARAIALRGDTVRTSIGVLPYEVALYGAARAGGRMEVVAGGAEVRARIEEVLPEAAEGGDPGERLVIEPVDAGGEGEGPARDRAVIEGADLCIAVSIRPGGQMERLLLERWRAGGEVRVVVPAEGERGSSGNRRLLEAGLRPLEAGWLEGDKQEGSQAIDGRIKPSIQGSDLPFARWEETPLQGPVLAHFTRVCEGPWPDQARREWLEDLYQGGARARRDVGATLRRILSYRVLRGNGRLIRGGYPVVSFTAVDPDKVAALHRYRRHLIRWEFQPYGVVFQRDWLEAHGARPVRYLPGEAFRGLSDLERPFFQKHAPPGCDYSAEEEWRVVGDLDFRDVPGEGVRVVVPGEGVRVVVPGEGARVATPRRLQWR